ncbi:tRNA pseudouridine(13) synthase TruD [Alteromonas sp. SM 2104]|nr:tRNA pseudouridine(13) synthase TruD [Alteromonas oceanisediminis]
MVLDTQGWQYLHGKPSSTGTFKQQPQDFIVREQLGYAPSGEGEHIYVWLEKTNLNTAFVAEQLAKFCQIPLRNVTYAGRKDKLAVTEQWFGLHIPGNSEPDWQSFALEGARVLSSQRHTKKLRTGVLKGNAFDIRLRDVTLAEDFAERLANVTAHGVPNYFAEQRFGVKQTPDDTWQVGGNLALAEKMLAGETIRNRNKRSMAISALRSWVFNTVVSARVQASLAHQPLPGDAIQLSGSNSFFICDQVDEVLLKRLQERDILLTAPMLGKGELASKDQAFAWESAQLNGFEPARALLSELGLRQERRALLTTPQDLTWKVNGDDLELQFSLPSGCYATSVLREIIRY